MFAARVSHSRFAFRSDVQCAPIDTRRSRVASANQLDDGSEQQMSATRFAAPSFLFAEPALTVGHLRVRM
jgi:hypothetical protein